jgi:hypothetical protein
MHFVPVCQGFLRCAIGDVRCKVCAFLKKIRKRFEIPNANGVVPKRPVVGERGFTNYL